MFWNLWELKQMFDKYKKLQEVLKNTIIRSREWWILIDLTAEMKVKDVKIEDESLLSPSMKETMENAIKASFEKAQQKAQEVAMTKTKEILWFDPNDLAWMMWWMWGWMPNIPWLWGFGK